jgi:imidazolonepropionase-like amidohydrolase
MARIVFTNANLVDGEHPAKPGTTVVVDGERIASVATGQLGGTRPDDRVVDLGGRTLMPGMITCHYHSTYHELGSFPAPYGLEEPPALQALRAANNLKSALMCGFTGAVSAGAAHEIDSSMKRAIDAGIIPGPRFVPSGRELSTTGHGNDNSPYYWGVGAAGAARLCDGEAEFRHAVRDEIKRGAEIIKLFVTGGHGTTAPKDRLEMTRGELVAAVETAHSRDALIRGHIVSKPGILLALDAGMDVIDHADDLDSECIDRAAELGTFIAPSIYFPTAFLEQVGGHGLGFTDSMKADLDHMHKVLPAANAAGVKLVVGDDYGAVGFPHGRYAAELEVYVRDAGMPPLEVIRWATKNGAELMRRGDELGTVAEGKLADLVVVDGDPLDDITVLQDTDRILAVMKGGELFKDTLPSAAAPA